MEGVKVEEEESEETEEVKEVDGANRGREDEFFSRCRSLAFNFACFSEESSPDSSEEFPEASPCSV